MFAVDPATRFALTWSVYGAIFGLLTSLVILIYIGAAPMYEHGATLSSLFSLIFIFGIAVPVAGIYALIGYCAGLFVMSIHVHLDWRTASKGFKPAQ
jgi:hypothetical protein